jgi:hypothetical protein
MAEQNSEPPKAPPQDFRDKEVRVVRYDDTIIGDRSFPHLKPAFWIGKRGIARSIYLDNRPCHDEAYLVDFTFNGRLYTESFVAHELELVEKGS